MHPSKKEELAQEYMPVVDLILLQERKKLGIEYGQILEEMRAYAMEGLAGALEKYDPARNTVFSTYADQRVRGAIYDGLCQTGWFPRGLRRKINFYRKSQEMIRSYTEEPPPDDKVEAVHVLGDKLKELATAYITTYAADSSAEPSSSQADADVAVERKEFREKINSCIESLPSNQEEIVRNYFFKEQPLPEIAKRMNISTSWASKLLAAALSKMRKSFGRRDLLDAIDSFQTST